MRSKLNNLFIFTLLSSCSARTISQSAISSALQDIMSPANTDKALQLINMAATKANKRIAIPDLARALAGNERGLPANGLPLPPGRIIVNENGLPLAIITNDGMVRKISREPEVCPQRPVVRQVVRNVSPGCVESMMPSEMYQLPIGWPQETACPCRSAAPSQNTYYPAPTTPYAYGAPNPYMPLASPMSAMSPHLPPPTQSRGQFLRKIPIPPPTL